VNCSIRILDRAGWLVVEDEEPTPGSWLAFYDPAAADGGGSAQWTTNLDEALHFRDRMHAVDTYYAVPANRPLRADGKPNRPLTAYTVEFVPVALTAGIWVVTG